MISKTIESDADHIVSEFEEDLKSLEGLNIIVTGANGMIPSYLVDIFIKNNQRLNNPSKLILYNKNKTTKTSRLGHLLEDKNIVFKSQDIGKPFEIIDKINVIIHGASRANPISFKQEPIDTIDANVNGTRTFLDYALKNNLDNFLFFSSSEVYGNPGDDFLPTSENYFGNVNCLGDMACYAESKRFSETLCSSFHRQYGINTKILRIFQTIGPGLRNDGKTIANMFHDGIKKRKITLKNLGLSKRSYAYVGDTARGILKVMFYGNPGEAYNIGDDTNYKSIRDVADIVNTLLDIKSPVECIQNYEKGERIQNRLPDITKLRDLGFKPKINLEESLKRTGDYYYEFGF